MKLMSLNTSILILLIGNVMALNAQTTNPEPIFGTVVIKKNDTDSTKKKSHVHLFRPAFVRIGIMTGVGVPLDGTRVGGIMGLRAEYGFSNMVSLVGELQANRNDNSSFPSTQSSLGVNIMPFKSKRLQPYFGMSIGMGGSRRDNSYNHRHYYYGDIDSNKNTFQVFGQMRLGLNYVLAKRFISTAEVGYQLPISNVSASNGGIALRVGFSYQFGKQKKSSK